MSYSCFIAYHGTDDPNGTYNMALNITRYIDKRFLLAKAYCGSHSDEHNFDQHSKQVVPNSKLFLAVVNDYLSENEEPVEPSTSKYYYFIDEVKAYINLVKNGLRNVKDFAIFYAGNKYKKLDEQRKYLEKVMALIDPDHVLNTGNPNFLVDFRGIDEWIDRRLILGGKSFFFDTYYPIGAIENKFITDFKTPRYSLLIEMSPKGGKSRLVDYYSKPRLDQLGNTIKDDRVFFIYRFSKNSSNSIEDFVSEVRDAFKNKKGKEPVSPMHYDFYRDKKSFAHYINALKAALYPDRDIVILLDSINLNPISSGMTILDYFVDINEFDPGIKFLMTCSKSKKISRAFEIIYNNHKSYEKSCEYFDLTNESSTYKIFLDNYYNDIVLRPFKLFDTTGLKEPDSLIDISAYSLLAKVASWYVANLEYGEKVDLSVVSSVKEALKKYLSLIRANTEAKSNSTTIFDSIVCLLILLSYASNPLTKEEIRDYSSTLFNKDLSVLIDEEGLVDEVLIDTVNFDGVEKYKVVHPSIIEALKECGNTNRINSFFSNIKIVFDNYLNMPLDKMLLNKPLFTEYLEAHLANISQNTEEFNGFSDKITDKLIKFDWGDDTTYMRKQWILFRTLFRFIDEVKNSLTAAKISARLGTCCFVLDRFEEGGEPFNKAADLYKEIDIDSLDEREKGFYIEFMTSYGSNLTHVKGRYTPFEAFTKPIKYMEQIVGGEYLKLHDFTNSLLAAGNVATRCDRDADDYEERLAIDLHYIEWAKRLLDASTDVNDLGQYGWYHQRIGSYYERKAHFYKEKDPKIYEENMALYYKEVDEAVKAYEYAYERAPHSFYLGNLVSAYGTTLAISKPLHLSKEEMLKRFYAIDENLKPKLEKENFGCMRMEAYDYEIKLEMLFEYKLFDMIPDVLYEYQNRIALEENRFGKTEERYHEFVRNFRNKYYSAIENQ